MVDVNGTAAKLQEILTPEQEKDVGLLQQLVLVLAQQLIALILVGGFVYMVAIKYEAPVESYIAIVSTVIGFYFGAKTAK